MTTMSSTPLGTAQPAPPLQQLPAAGLPTAQLPVFHTLRPDTIDARLQALEQNAHQQSQWQVWFLASQSELATCKIKNEELKKEIDKLTLKLQSFEQRVNNDFSLAGRHINAAFHRLSQVESHLTKAHHQLNERLTHTVQQQAAQADSFQNRYVAPLLSALHQLVPGAIVADQTDGAQSSTSRSSLSVTEKDAVDTPDASLLPSIVQQVVSTLPSSQLFGPTAAEKIMASHASQSPVEATAVPTKRSASSIDMASASRSGNDAAGMELSPDLPSTLSAPAHAASNSVRMPNVSTSSELKASPSQEVQHLATHQTVEVPSATAASSESSPGIKRKRTPSVEHIRTQIARRSTQSSIKSAGISPGSTRSVSSHGTAPAALPFAHAVSLATPHAGTPPSKVMTTAGSDAVQRNEPQPSTQSNFAISQQHLPRRSTVSAGPQGVLTVARAPLDLSDTPAVHARSRVADATVTKKQPPQRLLVPEAGDARVQPWQRLSPRSAQGLVKSLTSRSASRAGSSERPEPAIEPGAPPLPERPSTADPKVVRGSSSTVLSASTEGRSSAPAQASVMHASPPPQRPVTSAGGTSRRSSTSEDRRSVMEAAHSRVGPSEAFMGPRTSSYEVEFNEGRATSKDSLPPNWTRHRSRSQASPPSSPDVPLSSLVSSTDSSWPRRSSAGSQASTAAVPPESSSSDKAARTTGIASARQDKEPDVRLRALVAPNSASVSNVAAPPAEGLKRPSTAVRGALTADPRRKALLPTLPANSSGLTTSTASTAPIKPAAPLKHALPSKPLVSADQSARTQSDTSRSAPALVAPTNSPPRSVKLEPDAIMPFSGNSAERPGSSLPRSFASSSNLGRDDVGIQARVELGVRPSPLADAGGTSVATSSRPQRRTSSASAPASQAGQEPPQAPSAPLNTSSSARVQVEACPVPETPSSAESRGLPALDATEKQQTGQLQPHRSLSDPDKHQAAVSAHSAAPSSQNPSDPAADQRQGEKGSDQNRHGSKTQTLPRQHQSRVEHLASVERTWTEREGRSPYYFMAFLGRSSRPTALVVTDDSQITEPLISEDLANELLQDGNASRARGCESWLEVDLSWPYDTVKPHDRTVGCPAWFRAERCQFLIVPRIYMKEGICLGRRELRHLNLSMFTKGAGGRPYLSVRTAYEQGVRLSAFPSHDRKQHLTRPFQRLCHLAEVAVKRSQASWRVGEGTKRRDNTELQCSDSAHGDASGSNALHSHHEPRVWGRDTLPQESSFEAESSHERDSMSHETSARRNREVSIDVDAAWHMANQRRHG